MAVYVIADIEVLDRPSFEEYRQQVPATIAAHGGRYLAAVSDVSRDLRGYRR